MNLYEIDARIMGCIDEETGEILDVELLERLEMESEKKTEEIALWIKNLTAEAEALKNEKKAFEERQRAAEKKADSLKDYLSSYLNGRKFKTDRVQVSFRKSESVVIENVQEIEEFDLQYVKYGEPAPDETKIKAALKSGIAIPGARLSENRNIQIK